MQQLVRYIKSELGNLYTSSEVTALSRLILEELQEGSPAMLTTDKINHLSGFKGRKVNYSVKPDEQSQACLSYAMAQNSLPLAKTIVERLKTGEPVQYVLGKTEFHGLVFKVTPDVLIPRPETEELVEWVLDEAPAGELSLLDIGTGSGCIAVTLAKKLPGSEVDACDFSEGALAVAAGNARDNGVVVHCFKQDIFAPLVGNRSYDVVVSNPPYVLESEKTEMEENVLGFEPPEALFVPDHSPLMFYERIAGLALEILNGRGKLYFEINRDKGDEVREMLLEKGYEEVAVRNDISGNPRMVRAVRPDRVEKV